MGQDASYGFLRTDSRRELAAHHLVNPNSFFLLSRQWVNQRRTAAARRRSGHPQTAAQELRGWRGSLYDFEQIASRHQIDNEAPCPGSAASARCRCRGGIGCCGRENRSARANIVAARFGRLKQQRRCWRRLVGWQCLGAAARRMRPMCRKLEPRPSSRRWRWSARGN